MKLKMYATPQVNQEEILHGVGNREMITTIIPLTPLQIIVLLIKSLLHFLIFRLTLLSGLPSTFFSNVISANGSSSRTIIPHLLTPRYKLQIPVFKVPTLFWIEHQAYQTNILKYHIIDVCWVSETRIQDTNVVIHSTSGDLE